ncbi:hypothetical protein ACBJ59_61385 [Nonomuraea sp. MTCD27]|uniref:hypothetical protein n=1 Tax=Nonomuraea sp. MTCD27 TaxID=1676747 RepID=UPI0035BEDA33
MSMPIDQFPAGNPEILRDLARRIAALEAKLGVQQAVEVSKASGPFFLPNGTPTLQSGGLVIGASGTQFQVVDQVGNRVDIPCASVAPITLSNAGAAYDGTAQALINGLKTGHNDLLSTLKLYRLMKSS